MSIDELIDAYVQAAEGYNRSAQESNYDHGTAADVEIALMDVGLAVVQASGSEVPYVTPLAFSKTHSTTVPSKRPIPVSLRWDIWERDDFTCQTCGVRRFLSVDHIVAESKGGTLDRENLQTLCRSCNSRKGAR